ncbi:MAG: CPXCG motif-containing cysteine-rich protein [Gammaproteobacteria bacterium]|nr:CPXCG motif-containing cysteine-rich protein [Pseudomonadota bacterium]MDG2301907.1 CPXCG motif-containing cysteine-rich protein [Gammaproteobacteria bacterium]MBT5064840.1 CPXCG motif-containing cysteine-rich protein [Pseudomonadota bacterium]MBT6193672.1 CPXCG motif-containing cysteine-rich protein [Pseudomonadota bacterium]MBT6464403.1 CPXCG motif-containing cysteine-rich protein [Pseudomonadota bacterium]
MTEHFFQCCYCGEPISALLDCTTEKQKYVEDCEVCCQPIEIQYTAYRNEIVEFFSSTQDE